MLNGSRGDSTSVTKYPYVSPLPEAPSRLECYWYVDVSSRTGTIGTPFESIMSAANTSHPFSIPFSVFLPDRLCLCMSSWLPKAKIRRAVCLLYPAATVAKYRSTWVTLEYPLSSCVSQRLSSSFFFLAVSLSLPPLAATHPRCHEQVVPEGERDLLRLIPILETLPLRGRSIAPPFLLFFPLQEPLSPFFICLHITGLISILLSFFDRWGFRLGISGENELFPYVPWINRHKAKDPRNHFINKKLYWICICVCVCVIQFLYNLFSSGQFLCLITNYTRMHTHINASRHMYLHCDDAAISLGHRNCTFDIHLSVIRQQE